MSHENLRPGDLGQRILIYGSSCSGKSTFGEELAALMGVPCVELDGINWLPDWVGLDKTDPDELVRRFREATAGDSWVVVGSYTRYAQEAFWPRLHTIVFLDLPRWLLIVRVLRRSWRRWRTQEQLWGTTNTESFWRQLAVWRGEDSLIWWIWTNFEKRRQQVRDAKYDPRWRHIRFVHVEGTRGVEALRRAIGLGR